MTDEDNRTTLKLALVNFLTQYSVTFGIYLYGRDPNN